MFLHWMVHSVWKDERGVGSVAGLFIFFLMLLVGGLAIDYTNGVRTRAQLQVVADSAVLAAAKQLSEGPAAVRAAALEHVQLYGPNLLMEDDIHVGLWDDGTFTKTNADGANAVVINTRRSDRNSNPLPTHLLFLVGIDKFELNAPAIAARLRTQAGCSGGGYFARGAVIANSSNTYRDGFCLHGERSVTLHNVNRFEKGTVVSSSNLMNIVGHRNNDGLDAALHTASHAFSRTRELGDLFRRVEDAGINSDALPPYITSGPSYLKQINPSDTVQPGMLYFVDGDVALRADRSVSNVAIFATGNIRVQSNVELRDVILAARGSITVASNVRIGGSEADYCLRDIYSSYLLAFGDISFGSNNALRGIFMASQGNISLNSNNDATEGVYAEALGDITYNSASDKQGCAKGYDSELNYADWSITLVQ